MTIEEGTRPVAGVTVVAVMSPNARPASSYQNVRLQLGRMIADRNGAFTIEANDQDPEVRAGRELSSTRLRNFSTPTAHRSEIVLREPKGGAPSSED